MAGISKPPISIADNLRKEGKIQRLASSTELIDSNCDSHTILFNETENDSKHYLITTTPDGMNYHFDFECFYDINIYGYYSYYSTTVGNSINKKIILCDYDNPDTIIQTSYTPNSTANQWFKMFSNIPKGKYIIKTENIGSPNRPYITTKEWYIENISKKYLLKQNNQYYTIKSDFYKNGNYEFITELEGKEILTQADFETYGIDDLNLLTKTIDTQVVKGINKGNLGVGKYFEMSFGNDFININEVI